MRKLLSLILACLLSPLPAFAAFGAATAFDVQTTGADTNGGGFDSGVGSPGTDESMGSGTAITITLTGTTTGTGSPAFSSTTHGPGNFVHIASGSGCTTGWFEVLSQSVGVATFDHAMGTSTNICVGVIGGSLLTPQQATTNLASLSGPTVWIQTGTYGHTTTFTANFNGQISGYTSAHSDQAGKSCSVVSCPLITTATNSVDGLDIQNNARVSVSNVSFSSTAGTRGKGVYCPNSNAIMFLDQVILDGFSQAVASVGGGCSVVLMHAIEVKNSSSGANPVFDMTGTSSFLLDSYIHGNSSTSGTIFSSSSGNGVQMLRNTWYSNSCSTAGTDIIIAPNIRGIIANNNFVSNTTNSAAVLDLSSSVPYSQIENNVFYNNTATALDATVSGGFAVSYNNAFGSNSANGNTGTNPITLTADPFVAKSSGNFALNSTAGGGSALKAAGFPGVFPAGTTTGYIDVGAAQSQGSSGSGSTVQTTVQN